MNLIRSRLLVATAAAGTLGGCGADRDTARSAASVATPRGVELAAWNGRWEPTAALFDDPAMRPAWRDIAAHAPGWTGRTARDYFAKIARVDFAALEVAAPVVTVRGDGGRTLCAGEYRPAGRTSPERSSDHGHAVPPASRFVLTRTRAGNCGKYERLEMRPPNAEGDWDLHFHVRYGSRQRFAGGSKWNPSLRRAPVDGARFARLARRDAAAFARHLPSRR
jgi:hypothetical protein